MLSDGYYRGSSTLLAGPSGVGKTLLALPFIFAGTRRGETELIATFQENPTQLDRILKGCSWSWTIVCRAHGYAIPRPVAITYRSSLRIDIMSVA
jgi:KaiC/GvpD/RAD55 family RecA-like ATPase